MPMICATCIKGITGRPRISVIIIPIKPASTSTEPKSAVRIILAPKIKIVPTMPVPITTNIT